MILYFLRHAIAKDKSHWNKPDSDRPLTSQGVHKMRKTAKGFKHLDLDPDWVLSSPFRRAYDTAVIAADALKIKKKLKVVEDLSSQGSPEQLIRHLARDYRATDTLLLVGHEPYLSKLISVLIGASGPLGLEFKKGGLCRLEAGPLRYGRCATLTWWVPPKLLKRL